ncbi:ABC transporter permease [Sphingobium sufflavum]|uniref:ABC transporter permease n=1 Tax=Sphingobium sufflavum TaxID=1129547 RepID=UPI001F1DAF0D|nr:ABC transporter permease [Sphingobium sufflavum]MCE7797612.1 ABC transporter permease [Sphingobium sufflavum]
MNEIVRAALVIARRDFTALVRSKAFIFFLLTPIVMLVVAVAAGGIGARMAKPPATPVVAVLMPSDDSARLIAARQRLDEAVDGLPALEAVRTATSAESLLRGSNPPVAVLSGTLDAPRLSSDGEGARHWPDRVRLILDQARHDADYRRVALDVRTIALPATPAADAEVDRSTTAQMGQMALFLTTMLLAGMVLSNLVEEKTNKIIEILAASIPMESIFLGKLFAMLAMALIAIAAWAAFGAAIGLAAGSALPSLPPPAVGWPVFILLGILYFSTAYLLFGSLYLGIGAMAATVREVQTLAMPVNMGQLGVFLFASYAVTHIGDGVEMAACIIPFSSPFAALARAAQAPDIWPHLVLLLWQGLCTWAIIRIGTTLFRRNVLKSGGGRRRRKATRAGAGGQGQVDRSGPS